MSFLLEESHAVEIGFLRTTRLFLLGCELSPKMPPTQVAAAVKSKFNGNTTLNRDSSYGYHNRICTNRAIRN
jgi:hypothetical protein